MKIKIILLFIFLVTSQLNVFAVQEGKVISDIKTKTSVSDAFGDVNQFTDQFFGSPIKHSIEKKPEKKTFETSFGVNKQRHGAMLPIPKFRLMLQKKGQPKEALSAEKVNESSTSQAILDCDTMEYFADRTELEADGNVVMFFPQNNSSIKADKVVYNQTSNLIKAFGNVVLVNDGKEIFGDYMQVDMNEENAFLDNPESQLFQIKAKAKKGYMYGDKIIQEQGSMYVTKKTMINLRSEFFGPDLDRMYVEKEDKSAFMQDSHGGRFKIKTNDLIINSKKEHDTLTLKHAEIYFDNKKIATIPTITMHTNKTQDYVEANFPEMGTMTNMGLYGGPGFVFDTPMGTSLKFIPILNYQGNADTNESSIGYGAIGKFKSATNKTDVAYGTANNLVLVRGRQRLDDNIYIQYGANSYMDDWFMGFRMPKMLGEIIYEDSFENLDFLAKNRPMNFQHRLSAAYAQDYDSQGAYNSALGSSGGIGTMRFKYMAEILQNMYTYQNENIKSINSSIDMVAQGSTAVYGTGDTQVIARIGPRIHTQYKWWMQDVGYFLSAYNDNTPLVMYDKYMYGRSNVYIRESLRLSKYLTVSWFGSLNLTQDSWNGNLLQENGFYFAIGPDDVKLNIGYDTVRQQSFVTMVLHVDAKGSTVEYKKMVIKNPERLGKDKNGNSVNQNNGENSQKDFLSPQNDSDEEQVIERAEVIDIAQDQGVL